jgi:thiosulfate/3-mercaptopyruvate sulfurtransferase
VGESAVPLGSPLVEVEHLHSMIEAGTPVVILDVRWKLGASDSGRQAYTAGHIPGAHFVDLDDDLARAPLPGEGRHPLPDPSHLEALLLRWGVTDRHIVVAYDDSGGLSAARAWWVLRWVGVTNVVVLDGGLQAWRGIGGTLSTFVPPTGGGRFKIRPGQMPSISSREVVDLAQAGRRLDARAVERYLGEFEPVDAVAGHIPGALSAPTTANLVDGRFRSADELGRRFDELGLCDEVGVYCGSGVTAAHQILALEIAGRTGILYPGSWSEWISDRRRPVAGNRARSGSRI